MSDRTSMISGFLHAAGWEAAARTLVAGDASNRRYERLTRTNGDTVILMDAPADKGEDVRPFIDVTHALRAVGLSAPDIRAKDEDAGLLLIEDLGDALFARVMEDDPALEKPLYEASVDVLLHLHREPPPDLPHYDAVIMTDRASLAFDWYQRGALGGIDIKAQTRFQKAMAGCLAPLQSVTPVLIQRDYHAENLIWLPDRTGAARVGLLDYQDAMLGHPAYDLVSIAQDARRDVSADLVALMTSRYLAGSGAAHEPFHAAFAVLGAQRNLRILGVFARLSIHYGKAHYVDLIPRVWQHVQTNLTHPALAEVKPLIDTALPPPTPEILQRLKDQCATIPLP